MDDGFVYELHRKLKTDASSLQPNLALNAKRADILLMYRYTANRHGHWLASEVLADQLIEYGNVVDDRKGINNFAAATLELAGKLKKDCKGWKSSLPLGGPPNLKELLKDAEGDCANPSDSGCLAGLPSSKQLADYCQFMSQASVKSARQENCREVAATMMTPASTNVFSHKTPLAPHFSNRNAIRPPSLNQHPSGLVRNIPSHGSHAIDASNAPSSSGGIYFNRVGGRFKKWGSREKDVEPCGTVVDLEQPRGRLDDDPGWSRGSTFRETGSVRNHQRSHPALSSDRNQEPPAGLAAFKTAGAQLKIDAQKKYGNSSYGSSYGGNNFGGGYGNGPYHPAKFIKKSLGGKGVVNSKFVSPLINNSGPPDRGEPERSSSDSQGSEEVDERLKNIEPRMIELIKNEIMDCGSKITWDDIAGLHFAKTTIQEIVVWPMLRPDIFTGLRRPPKGILLFGPPGTGKTLIGKCIASQSGSTFFSISASSLTSKWIGEGEKMVRALFAVARVHQPAVVFIDEIDSLLSQRSESEHESSRRIKTEFLVQLDGAGTDEEDRLLVIGATNRPQELDEAARRRLVKRLYIPLPDLEARKEMIVQLMKCEPNELTTDEIDEFARAADGFSGADMKHLCQEACLGPIRSLGPSQISSIAAHQVRPVNMTDFTSALKRVHPSVGPDDLHQYVTWNKTYGSGTF